MLNVQPKLLHIMHYYVTILSHIASETLILMLETISIFLGEEKLERNDDDINQNLSSFLSNQSKHNELQL